MATLISNIGKLVNVRDANAALRGKELQTLPCLDNAYLIVESNRIAAFGAMKELKHKSTDFAFHSDAQGGYLFPSWCDSHTHLVFAGSREEEFVDKIKGLSYADIAAKGGGILSSAKNLADASEDDLFSQAYARFQDLLKLGTGAIEIKSGYGLTLEAELKMLRVIKRLKEQSPIPVKATFLGAHSFPAEYKENHDDYINLIIDQMIPAVANEELADYIDVFCEEGFFTPEQTKKICRAGQQFGLKPKIHANQLAISGGVQAGVAVDAISVDHLESMNEAAVSILANSNTIGTLLPSAAFFLRMPYQPARQLIDAGCAIALASDYNPGSSPSGNMNFVVALACIQMKMLPEEAINAATFNGACALELQQEVGSIAVGKLANFFLTKEIPSLAYLPYSFGASLIHKVMANGEWL